MARRLGRPSLDAVMGELLDDGTQVLRCLRCGTTRAPEPGEVAGFVRSGWPTCCTETMAWVGATTAEVGPQTPAAGAARPHVEVRLPYLYSARAQDHRG